ncbi:MAG: helix-turn-helix transcriptional regulator [Rhizobiaceae bacterium]|nr:helix-turn-helix transcriptional regulator [Rhizobiaceae bacterium]
MLNSQIQTAAISLFREAGEDFTLDQLQERTGLSRATLYRRIGNKESLLERLAAENLITLDPQADIKNRIYSAAKKVIANAGFIACTMEQIAGEAGLGIATLYRHFGDKETLLTSFVNQLHPRLDIQSILSAQDISLERDLRKVITIALKFFNDNTELAQILYSLQTAEREYLTRIRNNSPSTLGHINRYLVRHQKAGTVRNDISAADLAIILNGLLMQFSLLAPAQINRPLDVKKDTEIILTMFLRGAINK